jgi:hypothetical protein
VCSAKKERDLKRSTNILESYVSNKQKIIKGVKKRDMERLFQKEDN